MNDADLKATLTRVAAMGPCDCLVCQLVATPLNPRGIQPPAPKKKRAPRGQSLQAYMDRERGAR